ncbi:winged helix-turn-helix transcriptional regulator [Natronomonas gomsonensis]|mgnify:CR=1 FL=1|jgi:predicted transcriptional regulator|uniref:winged helix-turn-helix transcriptional regulator n=1 Tax=Natronomonas gomsonensis TaxID=1046043 RepID=UPI0020CA488D|nr:winged helix-turn-helix transcriptional regulator [Natronomonas gomsonensis]MCY4732213.1 winged helix-turn-helix transcriptional regulator [Natronomonas gomsonensis]
MIQRLARQLGKEERDLRVLEAVIEHQPIGITRVATETGIDEHKARYSLRMLEEDGLVEPTPDGAVTAEGFETYATEINEGLDGLIERMQSLKEIDL